MNETMDSKANQRYWYLVFVPFVATLVLVGSWVWNYSGPYFAIDTNSVFWLTMESENGNGWIFEPKMLVDVYENGMDVSYHGSDGEVFSQSSRWIDVHLYHRKGIVDCWVENSTETDSTVVLPFGSGVLSATISNTNESANFVAHSVEPIAREDSIVIYAMDTSGTTYSRTFTGQEIYELTNGTNK